MLSLDTETTGTDLHHGAKPYLVTMYDGVNDPMYWEWDVDPLTREPLVQYEDLEEIQSAIRGETLVLQNSKFDRAALHAIYQGRLEWDWGRMHDTLIAGHLLHSNEPHDLTSMVATYLGTNIQPYELRLERAVKEARTLVKREFPEWRVAKKDLPEMPSAKDKVWKYDAWLPRALAKELDYHGRHHWWAVLSEYANADSVSTFNLFKVQERLLREADLWEIYLERMKALPVAYDMESRGITISRTRLEELAAEYSEESARLGRVCVNIAADYGKELVLPKSGNNKSLLEFTEHLLEGKVIDAKEVNNDYGGWPTVTPRTPTGQISLNKNSILAIQAEFGRKTKPYRFFGNLISKRKRDTALTYMQSYQRFWLPQGSKDWFVLHPNLNPTGTDTLRWSSNNPNEQNISKQEGFNLRYCFGPAPGREWWSMDAKNIELRIPAYEAGEEEMIDIFERPKEPPYYGSFHLLCFHTVYPKLWEKELRDVGEDKVGPHCKDKYESTWYQWCKNGDFAVQYGSVEQSGTADRAYHQPGAFAQIKSRFKRIHGPGGLNDRMIAHAEQHGYVETIPDRTVNPRRGYPLYCTRSQWGRILPTVPLNYHVQSTAMWWMMKSMLRCHAQLEEWRAGGFDGHVVMQVHDELVFDLPRGATPQTNLPKVHKLRRLMEQGGEDIGVPTPVSVEYHPDNWSETTSL